MAAVHHDKSFSHPLHIVLIFLTLGLWFPVWLARWQMHKTDRVREAISENARYWISEPKPEAQPGRKGCCRALLDRGTTS